MQDNDDVLLRKHCIEEASVVTYFWVPTQKKIQKNIYSEGIQKNNRSEKMMLERP
jgi:phage terminase large subunit-like protein